VNSLQAKVDATGQQYDQAVQQRSAARGPLTQVHREAAAAQARFLAARGKIAQTAAAAYEDQGQNSVAGILTSSDPSAVLDQASLLLQLTGSQDAQAKAFLDDARQLAGVQQQLQHTEYGIAALRTQLAARKASIGKLLASKQATLDSLTVPQQAVVAAGGVGAGGTTTATDPLPASTQAGKAVAFAYVQLGKPYQWGATGPGSYDCSGLAQAAWASAGWRYREIRTSNGPPCRISRRPPSSPGTCCTTTAWGTSPMYVGNGYVIDAPQTGSVVQKLPMDTSWYAATYDGVVRP
jgi:cell wall-associated NlpC family hydrolase